MNTGITLFRIFGAMIFMSAATVNLAEAAEFDPNADWKISAYLWATGLDGTLALGPIEADLDLSFSDLVSSVDIGGSVVARRDWSANMIVGDLTYLSLSPDDAPGPLGGTISSSLKLSLLTGYYGRKWGNTDRYGALLLGARYMEMDLGMTATPSLPTDPVISMSGTPSFTDALIGGLFSTQLNEKWSMFLQGDFGVGGSNNSYSAQLMFQRKFQGGNMLDFGFRALSVDFDESLANGDLFALDANMLGLIVGFTWD